MPPVRSAPIKPTTTTRTHAENQERAYIAASRRSDRSLEARVESARRASEIHKQRTGRSLRVREEDVLNEEMYEEEDDDMHWQYRRMGLIGNFPVNPDLQRRFEAFTSFNMERANLLARAVANVNQNSPQSPQYPQDQQPQQQQFMNPGMMQQGYQSPVMGSGPPSKRTSSNYRQSPYPVQGGPQQQSMRPPPHQRSVSIANPQNQSMYQQQYKPSAQTYPGASNLDQRRSSLPPQNMAAQNQHIKPESQRGYSSAAVSPNISRQGPAALTPTSQHAQSPQQMTPQPQYQSSQDGHDDMFNSNSNFKHGPDSPYGPLTTSLPMETQQMLAGGPFPGYGDYQGTWGQDLQQPFYSYNPNSKPRAGKMNPSQSQADGLNQTLMPTSLDTNISSMSNGATYDSPLSGNNDYLNSAVSNPSYGFGFDNNNMFSLDPFASGSSGQRTPQEDFMNQYVDGNMFTA